MAINPFWQNAFGANAAQYGSDPGPGGIMADQPATGGGLFGVSPTADTGKRDQLMAMAASLLAGSGYSPVRRSSSEILGQALLAGQQARAQQQDRALRQRYTEAQIHALERKETPSPFGQVNPEQYTPESVQEFQRTGDYSTLKAAAKPTTAPAGLQEYEYAKSQGYKGTFFDYQVAIASARAAAVPPALQNVDRPTPDGGKQPGTFDPRAGVFTPDGAPVPAPPKQPTEADKKAKLLYGEMVDAEKQFRAADGADTSSKWNSALATTPITRVFTSEDFRKHEAAGTRWAQNFLYLKSGASAPVEEVRKTFVQYLPQPGDSKAVIEQKREAREQAMANVAAANSLPLQQWSSGKGPAVGTVEDGHRFKGGNPADPNSWEPVQ